MELSSSSSSSSSWKDNFKPNNFLLKHDNPTIFFTSQWQRDKKNPSLFYVLIRFGIFATFFVIWILSLTSEGDNTRWAIYLTNWGFTVCMLQSFFAVAGLTCILLGTRVMDNTKLSTKALVLYKVYWVLNIMATTLAFTITLVFWTLIYYATGMKWSTMNFMVHGVNSILIFIDFCIVSHPVRLLHFIYPILIGLVYLVVTIIFYVLGGTMIDGSRYIYPILKWDKPGITSLYCLGVMIVMITIHTITYFLHKVRIRISKLFYEEDKGSSNSTLYKT